VNEDDAVREHATMTEDKPRLSYDTGFEEGLECAARLLDEIAAEALALGALVTAEAYREAAGRVRGLQEMPF